MIPVTQTDFSMPGGNCFAACVASLLELPLERVPNFHGMYGENWLSPFTRWLKDFGLWPALASVLDSDRDAQNHLLNDSATAIAGGCTKFGFSHACLYQGKRLIWDPFPSGIGLEIIHDLTFLIPIKLRFASDWPKGCWPHIILEAAGWFPKPASPAAAFMEHHAITLTLISSSLCQ